MNFAHALLATLKETGIDTAHLEDASPRINKLCNYSSVYRHLLRRYPEYIPWLEDPKNRDIPFRYSAFITEWENDHTHSDTIPLQQALQRFRRKMSLRIAYRDINQLATCNETLNDLSHLADFCVQTAYRHLYTLWEKRLGTPWHDKKNRPCRFCILGLGKLGGHELNFCSDIDPIFFFEEQGQCRKNDTATAISNSEFFTRMGRELITFLQTKTEDGFLFNIDMRLRPEGETAPLVRSLNSMENYYFVAGQLWERLAFIKARPIAGDITLGEELLESLNAFRYPRNAPYTLLPEIAGVKIRTEKEVVGEEQLLHDVKSGHGGIREIEFIVQTQQLMFGGKNPFLQTPSTLKGLEQLSRYKHITPSESTTLSQAYTFLRTVENRLQMREEVRTHTLPTATEEQASLAQSLEYASWDIFKRELDATRKTVRKLYLQCFENAQDGDTELEEWILFLSNQSTTQNIQDKLTHWFGNDPDISDQVRHFALGGPQHLVTREQASLFLEITQQFDTLLPLLTTPLKTLMRVNTFAEHYGARKQFFKTCSQNHSFFKALCLLFDRSHFIHELLCHHPEIMEELLYEGLQRKKDKSTFIEEIKRLPQGKEAERFLWLYIKAEQIRIAIAEVLETYTLDDVEHSLTELADAAVITTLQSCDPKQALAVIALGKYGSRELVFGSDLDIIILGEVNEENLQILKTFRATLEYQQRSYKIFELDTRLRPYGNDGPLITSLTAFDKYHQNNAQLWERQLLLRARPIAGVPTSLEAFTQSYTKLIKTPISQNDIPELWDMRLRIEKEKTQCTPPELAFKTCAGGLIDIEFLAQIAQLFLGKDKPTLFSPNTRKVLDVLAKENLADNISVLIDNFDYLRKIQLYLRRNTYTPVTEIPSEPKSQLQVARWLGFSDYNTFWSRHTQRLSKNRQIVENMLSKWSK